MVIWMFAEQHLDRVCRSRRTNRFCSCRHSNRQSDASLSTLRSTTSCSRSLWRNQTIRNSNLFYGVWNHTLYSLTGKLALNTASRWEPRQQFISMWIHKLYMRTLSTSGSERSADQTAERVLLCHRGGNYRKRNIHWFSCLSQKGTWMRTKR